MRLLSRKYFPKDDVTLDTMANALWLEEREIENLAAAIVKAFDG